MSQSPNNQVSKRPDDKMCRGNCRQKWQNGETGDTIWVRGCFIEPLDIPYTEKHRKILKIPKNTERQVTLFG